MAGSEIQQAWPPILENRHPDAPRGADLDKCVHCGLCLNACPTYRELGVEMDSPRGRIYQMVQVATGQAEPGPSYLEHMDLCLGCRACESACPSGVPYGRLIEAARAEIAATSRFSTLQRVLRWFVFGKLLPSRPLLKVAGAALYLVEASGLRLLAAKSGILTLFGKLGRIEPLAPPAEAPFFFSQYGRTFPPAGEKRARVAMLGGCIANVFFARLNEATVRVLQRNGCEVVVPEDQTCCGALHAHAGEREKARELARRNIDAILPGGFDAVISNTAGCGAMLKEYHELLEHDAAYAPKAHEFIRLVKDVNEYLCTLGLRGELAALDVSVTYQDSCHLLHGQKVREAPRELLKSIPGLELLELPFSDVCCGSAGVYNIVHDELAAGIIQKKMDLINATGAQVIATANPGCMIQLRAGAGRHGKGQPVKHVVELLDESYRKTAR